MSTSNVTVVGSLPPPITGQHLQTRLNAELLSRYFDVSVVDTSTGREDIITELNVLTRVRHYFSAGRRIRHALERRAADAIVWHSMSTSPLGHLRDVTAVVPSFRGQGPVYAVVHSGQLDRLLMSGPLRTTTRYLIDRIEKFVFLSDSLSDLCAELLPREKRHVIPNTIESLLIPDEATISHKLSRWNPSSADRRVHRILFVANMIPSKGYMQLLRSLPILRRERLLFEARFVGRWKSDSDRATFERERSDLGLAEQVTHLGQLRNPHALAREYLEADVFVLPTYYPTEAQPMSVIEALASATPVVVSRHASLPSMVVDGREARFVDPHSPDSVAASIRDVLKPTAWSTAAAEARRRFDERYRPEIVLAEWTALLEGSDA